MDKVGAPRKVGTREKDNLHYKGMRLTTIWPSRVETQGEFYFIIDGDEYLDAALPMEIPEGKDVLRLEPKGTTHFRSVAGCVGYRANAFCAELSLECSMLDRRFSNLHLVMRYLQIQLSSGLKATDMLQLLENASLVP